MIDNKNIDPSAKFMNIPVTLRVGSVAASQSDVEQDSFRAPFAGKIVSVHATAVAITDADDSARIDVKKATTSVLSATINPTAGSYVAGTVVSSGVEEFAAGDKIGLFATTGGSDLLTNVSVTVVIRAFCGKEATRPSV